MANIHRLYAERMRKDMGRQKAILLFGPRQVGKTTLIKDLLAGEPYLYLNGDDRFVCNQLENIDLAQLQRLIGSYKTIVIDEAQRIPNIGLTIKLIIDNMPGINVFVTGSSSLDLGNKLQEPLTGRKIEYNLFPICWQEYESKVGYIEAQSQLERRVCYGMYPDVINNTGDEYAILKSLTNSYLYKDILSLSGIRKPAILDQLLKALALQIGSEVSYNEISNLIGVDKKTITHYIDLLCKVFVLFEVTSYSQNERNEVKNSKKIYFYDTGIRNMVINNFVPLHSRNDKGGLWENFLVAERLKTQSYFNLNVRNYFWRSIRSKEIDWVEQNEQGELKGYEFKWKGDKKPRFSRLFTETYNAEGTMIDNTNFRDFICQAGN